MSFAAGVPAPRAEARPRTRTLHGRVWTDDFLWLRPDGVSGAVSGPDALPADIRSVVEAERTYYDAVTAGTADLRAEIARELRGRIAEVDASVPSVDGPFAYYTRTRPDGQHAIHCRVPLGGGPEQIVVDGDHEARSRASFSLDEIIRPSPRHRLVLWAYDSSGEERYTLRIRDVAAGRDLPDEIPDVSSGSFAWLASGRAFLYARRDAANRPTAVYLHCIGTPVSRDRPILRASDPRLWFEVFPTRSRAYVVLDAGDASTISAQWVVGAGDERARPMLVTRRREGVRHFLDHRGGDFLILTDAGDLRDRRIVAAPVNDPRPERWREIVPHVPGRTIERFLVFRDHIATLEWRDGHRRLVLRAFPDLAEHVVDFGEEPTHVDLGFNRSFEARAVRVTVETMTRPQRVVDVDMTSGVQTVLKEQTVPSGHDPGAYVSRRLTATAPDGAEVPVTILERRGAVLDRSRPLWLAGYGAYGDATNPAFLPSRFSLVDRGFTVALAHTRGGIERGQAWHDAGSGLLKRNSFVDFVTAATMLIAEGHTDAGRIVAFGSSAGGLLVTAAAHMSPRLFAAVVADVPVVDVIEWLGDPNATITTANWGELGNPLTDPRAFEAMLAYDPIHTVPSAPMPAMLIATDLTDTRVPFFGPLRYVQRLRATMTGGGPVLARITSGQGHSGFGGRFDFAEESAHLYAFAITAANRR